jgi:hypothetical protein
MHLFFLDGSGNTGRDLSHASASAYYLMALAVPGGRARALEDSVTSTLGAHFGERCRTPGFECKGSDLFRGEGPCAAMPPAERIALYQALVGLVVAHGARLLWQGIDKARLAARYAHPMHPHKLAFVFLAEQIERYLRGCRDYGLLVSDEEKEVEAQVVEDLLRYKEFGTSMGFEPLDLTRVVDNVHWVKSHNSRLLQLCDVCVYLCQRYVRDRDKTSANARAVQRLWEPLGGSIVCGRVWPR